MQCKTRFLKADMVPKLMTELQDSFELVDEQIAEWAHNYGQSHIKHYQDVITHVRQIIDVGGISGRVLDIGAVPGHITAILKYAGIDVEAVDIAPERAVGLFKAMSIPTFKVNIEVEPLPFEDNSYDLILFNEILEHLRIRPLFTLQQIYRVLCPGGHLLLSVPNITPLMRWHFLLGEDYQDDLVKEFEKIKSIGHMGHFRYYSRNEIEHILSHIGFNIVQIDRGGKKVQDKRLDSRLFSKLMPHKMVNQLYVWTYKPEFTSEVISKSKIMHYGDKRKKRCFSF